MCNAILFKKFENLLTYNPNDFENPPQYNRDKFSSWWKVPDFLTQCCNPPKGNCSATTIRVHYIVDGRHVNFLHMFKLECVCLLGKESRVFI